jgi:hypothetical protein
LPTFRNRRAYSGQLGIPLIFAFPPNRDIAGLYGIFHSKSSGDINRLSRGTERTISWLNEKKVFVWLILARIARQFCSL